MDIEHRSEEELAKLFEEETLKIQDGPIWDIKYGWEEKSKAGQLGADGVTGGPLSVYELASKNVSECLMLAGCSPENSALAREVNDLKKQLKEKQKIIDSLGKLLVEQESLEACP